MFPFITRVPFWVPIFDPQPGDDGGAPGRVQGCSAQDSFAWASSGPVLLRFGEWGASKAHCRDLGKHMLGCFLLRRVSSFDGRQNAFGGFFSSDWPSDSQRLGASSLFYTLLFVFARIFHYCSPTSRLRL